MSGYPANQELGLSATQAVTAPSTGWHLIGAADLRNSVHDT